MIIKPIETTYKGYRFRSRLEARWAVFFDVLGLEWEYEKEGFDLGETGWYLPDFFIKNKETSIGWFVEVKGDMTDTAGINKAHFLDNYPPKYAWGCLMVGNLEYAKIDPLDFSHTAILVQRIAPIDYKLNANEINKAINRARQARFEFGEHGYEQ